MHRLHVVGVCLLAALATTPAAAGQTVDATHQTAPVLSPRESAPRVLAGTHGSAFSTIQGNVFDSANGALPNSPVRLRDARHGGIVSSQVTDKTGMFVFRQVDPGTYVVELVGGNHEVLAASELLSVAAGETRSAVIRLPFRLPPLGGLLGHTVQQAVAVTAAAAAAGVLAASVTGVDASAR